MALIRRSGAQRWWACSQVVVCASSLAMLLTSSPAQAKARARAAAAQRDFRGGSYVLVSPGLVHVPIGDEDSENLHDAGYLWGVGAGIVRSAGPLRWGLGIGFEHAVYNFSNGLLGGCGVPGGSCDLGGGLLRASLQLRIGGGGKRIFGYGLVGPSALLSVSDFNGRLGIWKAKDTDIDPGLGVELAAGLQFRLFRGLVVGFEPGIDLGFLFNEDREAGDDVYGFHTIDLELFAGWYF